MRPWIMILSVCNCTGRLSVGWLSLKIDAAGGCLSNKQLAINLCNDHVSGSLLSLFNWRWSNSHPSVQLFLPFFSYLLFRHDIFFAFVPFSRCACRDKCLSIIFLLLLCTFLATTTTWNNRLKSIHALGSQEMAQ